jgi:hypothetical protein
MCLDEINKVIADYAQAYKHLNALQKKHADLLPKGDQKTGIIGEHYAPRYAQSIYGIAKFSKNSSQKGWDIQAENGGSTIKIQVKTVSAYSKTRAITPLYDGWDHLYLIHLNDDFKPDGFWILLDDNHDLMKETNPPVTGLKMRDPNDHTSGSKVIWDNKSIQDKTKEMLAILEAAK